MSKKPKLSASAAKELQLRVEAARAQAKQLRAHAALEREIATSTKRLEKLIRQRDDSLQTLAEFIVERKGTHRIVWKEPIGGTV